MAIIPSLLIAAPMLQDLLIDKTTGLPLAGGIVTFYQDTSRSTLKNVYYQTGSPGSYTYIQTNNPMTLTAVGTFADPSGNDIIPYFYPYDENNSSIAQPYYITVYNSLGQLQFTRSNFPFIAVNGSTPENILNQRNYIVNNVFWRNFGLNTNIANSTTATLAPGAHEGFSMPDVQYVKNVGSPAPTEQVSFPAPASVSPIGVPFTGDVTPETCLYFQCSVAGTGEQTKVVQWPINLHLETLTGQQAVLTYWAVSTDAATIQPYIYAFAGTNAPAQPAATPIGSTQVLGTNWTQYRAQFTFPAVTGITLPSATGDDAFYLQFGLPLNQICNIGLTKPVIYLASELPTSNILEFDTYDEIDAIINSPRTGDVRTSMSRFGEQYGWVNLDDGTIGSASSMGTTRKNVDTWQLFNLLWTYGSQAGFSTWLPIFDNTGMSSTYGGTAYIDWNAGKSIQLPLSSGRVIGGGVPDPITVTYTSASSTLTLTFGVYDSNQVYVGAPVSITVTGTTTLTAGIYWLTNLGGSPFGTTVQLANSFVNAIEGTNITFTGTPTGSMQVNPVPASIGENSHTLLQAELPNVNLNMTGVSLFQNGNTSNGSFAVGDNANTKGTSSTQTGVVSLGGSARPFNINQFTTFMNRYIKL